MSSELRQLAQLLADRSNSFVSFKQSAVPVQEIDPSQAPPAEVPGGPGAPPPPVDPATGQPMDPAAAGGAPVDPATGQPMDPAMAQQMMDPAMAGGMPPEGMPAPEEDPLVQMLQQMADNIQKLVKESAQNRQMIATILDASGLKVPTDEILRAGEDAAKDALPTESPSKEAMFDYDGYAAVDAAHSDGIASYQTASEIQAQDARPALTSALQVAGLYFNRNR